MYVLPLRVGRGKGRTLLPVPLHTDSEIVGGYLFAKVGFIAKDVMGTWVYANDVKNYKTIFDLEESDLDWTVLETWEETKTPAKERAVKKLLGKLSIQRARQNLIRCAGFGQTMVFAHMAHVVVKIAVQAGERGGIDLAPLFAMGGHETYASNILEKQYAAVIYVWEICLSMISRKAIINKYDDICTSYLKHLSYGSMDIKTFKPDMLRRIAFMFGRLVLNRSKDIQSDVS